MNVIMSPSTDITDEELDAQLAMIIRAQAERGRTAVRDAIDRQFPDVPTERLKASTGRLAQRGFAVSDADWHQYRRDLLAGGKG